MASLRLVPILALVALGILGSPLLRKPSAGCGETTACRTACCDGSTPCCCGGDESKGAAACEDGPCLGRGGSEMPIHLDVENAPLAHPTQAIDLESAGAGTQVFLASSDDSWTSRRPTPERAPPRA